MVSTNSRRSYHLYRHLRSNFLHAHRLPCASRFGRCGLVERSFGASKKTRLSRTDRHLPYVLALCLRALGGIVRAGLSQLRPRLYWEIDSGLTAQHNQSVAHLILLIVFTVCVLVMQGLIPPSAIGQGCAMCRTVLPQASEPIARGMFWCVLILLTAPFAVCATIGGWLFYQYRRAFRGQRLTASVTPLRTFSPTDRRP